MKFAAKQGTLYIEEQETRLVMLFTKQVLWSFRHEDVEKLDHKPGTMMDVLHIHLRNGSTHTVELGKQFANQIVQFYKQRAEPVQTVQIGRKWYEDPTLTVHVETYTNENALKKEVEAAAQFGWVPQTSTGVAGHINVGRTTTAAVLTGGWSLLLGASRSKDKWTITFVRQQQR